MKLFLISLATFLFLGASAAAAGTQGAAPKIALHLGPHATKTAVDCNQWTVPCSQFLTGAVPRTPADVYVVLAGGDSLGFAGLSCGLEYARGQSGVNVLTWTFCGDWQFPSTDWPEPGSGSRMTWNAETRCQRSIVGTDGVHALAGVFYIYAYGWDTFAITEHTKLAEGPELQVADCTNAIYFLDPETDAGRVTFSDDDSELLGFNPCTGTGTPPGTLPPPPSPPPPAPPPSPAPPAPTEPQKAAVVLHIGEPNSRVGCDGVPASVGEVVTAAEADAEGLPYYVYVLGAPEVPEAWNTRAPEYLIGLTGLRFGIDYLSETEEGIRIFSWQSCAGSAVGRSDWPQRGSGITLLWPGECQNTALAVGGYFYVSAYAPAVMSVVPYPGKGSAAFENCDRAEGDFIPMDSHRVGWISMGGAMMGLDANGCNPLLAPCDGPTAVEPTTWGRLKTRFSQEN